MVRLAKLARCFPTQSQEESGLRKWVQAFLCQVRQRFGQIIAISPDLTLNGGLYNEKAQIEIMENKMEAIGII